MMTLRARQDVSAGRLREAAIQLEAALSAARVELTASGDKESAELLVAHGSAVAAAAEQARSQQLDSESAAAVEVALARLESAVRRAQRSEADR